MLLRRALSGAALGVNLMVSVSGCATYDEGANDYSGNESPADIAVEEVEPDYEALADQQAREIIESQPWECFYAPSYDDDWHNDVTCTNGTETETPYLREWDSFITEDEIMESALEYEDHLNAGR